MHATRPAYLIPRFVTVPDLLYLRSTINLVPWTLEEKCETFLRNVGNRLPNGAASHPRRPQSSKIKFTNTSKLKQIFTEAFPDYQSRHGWLQPGNPSMNRALCLQNKCYLYLMRDTRYVRDKRMSSEFVKLGKLSHDTNNTISFYLFV